MAVSATARLLLRAMDTVMRVPQPVVTLGHAAYIINTNLSQGLTTSVYPLKTALWAIIRTGGGGILRGLIFNQKPPVFANRQFIPLTLAAWYAHRSPLSTAPTEGRRRKKKKKRPSALSFFFLLTFFIAIIFRGQGISSCARCENDTAAIVFAITGRCCTIFQVPKPCTTRRQSKLRLGVLVFLLRIAMEAAK